MGCHCLLQSGPKVAIFLDTESRMVVARFGIPSCLIGLKKKKKSANSGESRDAGSIQGSGRTPGAGKGKPLQYSCLENPMEGGAWQATVHRVAESQTRLSTHILHRSVYWVQSFSFGDG